MTRTANLLGLALTWLLVAKPEPLRVKVVVAPKPHYVGQAVELRIDVEGNPVGLTVDPPRIAGAEVYPQPIDPARPSSSRYLIVPTRSGPLDLPPFRARAGDRSGIAKPTRLSVANVSVEGRTAAFLGGVGDFEVKAEADPASFRVGQTLEYRVKVSGLAALGSVRAPDLNGWKSPSLAVEATDNRLEAVGTPVRTFRYRIRPLKAGPIVLPPVAVAAFDPATQRYATRATSGVPVQVEDPPRFDPDRLDYSSPASNSRSSRATLVGWAIGAVAVVSISALAGWRMARRRRVPGRIDPRRLALDLARGLGGGGDEVEDARAVVEALTTFLHRACGRSPGVLTPPEARIGFEQVTGDPGLAGQAEALVNRCDRSRYGLTGNEAMGILSGGRRFFESLEKVIARRDRDGVEPRMGGPGEAVETASTL